MSHRKGKGATAHLTVAKLSRMSARDLRAMENLRLVVGRKHKKLAVLIPYYQYLELRRYYKNGIDTVSRQFAKMLPPMTGDEVQP